MVTYFNAKNKNRKRKVVQHCFEMFRPAITPNQISLYLELDTLHP